MKYRYRVVLLNFGSSCTPDMPMLLMISEGGPCPRSAFGGGKRWRGARLDNRRSCTATSRTATFACPHWLLHCAPSVGGRAPLHRRPIPFLLSHITVALVPAIC